MTAYNHLLKREIRKKGEVYIISLSAVTMWQHAMSREKEKCQNNASACGYDWQPPKLYRLPSGWPSQRRKFCKEWDLPKDTNNSYLSLLAKFPSLTQVFSSDHSIQQIITHHIRSSCLYLAQTTSSGMPSNSQTRIRAQALLGDHLPLSSWSSPLHMVPKKTPGNWWQCGDYRSFNEHLQQYPAATLARYHKTFLINNKRRL